MAGFCSLQKNPFSFEKRVEMGPGYVIITGELMYRTSSRRAKVA
jgi:hypothetical protein